MKNILKRGFTLIELLIVIGILAVLIVVVLLIINPGKAQANSRDAVRMKDLGTLQAVLNQYLDDGNTPDVNSCLVAAGGCTSVAGSGKFQPCDSNWLGVDVCDYAQSVPLDPNNGATRTCVNGGTVDTPTFDDNCSMMYRVKIEGGKYEINVRQESKNNADNAISDGGNSSEWAEIGSDRTLLAD